jgi:hypothetical protein
MSSQQNTSITAVESDEGWLSLAEVVERLHRSHSTVERLVARDELVSKLFSRPGRKPERLYSSTSVNKLVPRFARRPQLATTTRKVKSSVRTREFVFDFPEGPIRLILPPQLGSSSLTDAIDFMNLLLRRLKRDHDANRGERLQDSKL